MSYVGKFITGEYRVGEFRLFNTSFKSELIISVIILK